MIKIQPEKPLKKIVIVTVRKQTARDKKSLENEIQKMNMDKLKISSICDQKNHKKLQN